MRKIYNLLLSKHIHDIPDYKHNYEITVDRKTCPSSILHVLLSKSKPETSSSELTSRFH